MNVCICTTRKHVSCCHPHFQKNVSPCFWPRWLADKSGNACEMPRQQYPCYFCPTLGSSTCLNWGQNVSQLNKKTAFDEVIVRVCVDILCRSRSVRCVTWLWQLLLWNKLSLIQSATLAMARYLLNNELYVEQLGTLWTICIFIDEYWSMPVMARCILIHHCT